MEDFQFPGRLLYDVFRFDYSVPDHRGEHWCRLRIIKGSAAQIVVITQPSGFEGYVGLSVANGIEHIISAVKQFFASSEIEINSETIFVVQHSADENQLFVDKPNGMASLHQVDLDIVEPDDHGQPQWTSLSVLKLFSMLG